MISFPDIFLLERILRTLMTLHVCSANCTKGQHYTYSTKQECSPCNRGFYQDMPWQTSCIKCPNTMTTISTGSTSANDCKRTYVHARVNTLTRIHKNTNTFDIHKTYLFLKCSYHNTCNMRYVASVRKRRCRSTGANCQTDLTKAATPCLRVID